MTRLARTQKYLVVSLIHWQAFGLARPGHTGRLAVTLSLEPAAANGRFKLRFSITDSETALSVPRPRHWQLECLDGLASGSARAAAAPRR